MNIVVIVPRAYVGVTPAGGAETYLHDLLKVLAKRHKVSVFTSASVRNADIDGVIVDGMLTDHSRMEKAVAESDLIMTQLDGTPMAQSLAERGRKPLVQIIHNTNEFSEGFLAYGVDLAVYNAAWVSEYHETLKKGPMTKYWSEKGKVSLQLRRQTEWPSIIVPPTVHYDDYSIGDVYWFDLVGGAITLVNPCDNKGQHIFYELARRCPDLNFLAVVGGYQPEKQKFVDLPNVTKHEHVRDMREVYKKTSVVVMPSTYESYGRIAVEAACAGVPSVVSSTPGLVEAMGTAAGYVTPVELGDFSTIEEWEKAIRYTLSDYQYCHREAKKRAQLLTSQSYNNIARLEKRLVELADTWVS